MYHGLKKILCSTTVFNIDNNQHIIMISEGSCDTEDWRNYADRVLFLKNMFYFQISNKLQVMLVYF